MLNQEPAVLPHRRSVWPSASIIQRCLAILARLVRSSGSSELRAQSELRPASLCLCLWACSWALNPLKPQPHEWHCCQWPVPVASSPSAATSRKAVSVAVMPLPPVPRSPFPVPSTCSHLLHVTRRRTPLLVVTAAKSQEPAAAGSSNAAPLPPGPPRGHLSRNRQGVDLRSRGRSTKFSWLLPAAPAAGPANAAMAVKFFQSD
jgi:hypothetical protein